ncbi:protocatechuate 4,5-dioxygenase subunit alpha [Novosphingobium sp. KACC 22771]|uniref:protocatechuate 4,5-dioxygenase subunit alpha n=1 Tax=Novosphingobium sp. KACC 22771 TaxID=3025670 RepID=UPI002365FCD0|nr:protocatechuate 4,5-dioxygenase subunit alpha [Novosphingobium sp. KACC 22771]WDF72218.1 protocatechuate 4,5-dioxygenase subunit alpha [Novosphingobium sp. KACC 22771]
MSGPQNASAPIPGTHLFDGDAAAKGFALNAMCYSFNDAANRQAFLDDEEAYCAKFHLTPQQREAVAQRSVLGMIEAGGNIYYLAKLAGIFGLNVQDVGSMQTGVSVDNFKSMLLAQGAGQTYDEAHGAMIHKEKVHG